MTEEWSPLPCCLLRYQRVIREGVKSPSTSDLIDLQSIPAEIKEIPNWVVWRIEVRDNDPKKTPTKVPYRVLSWSQRASSIDEETWSPYEDVVRRLSEDFEYTCPTNKRDPERVFSRLFDGLGFVFDGGGVCGIDLDGALDRDGNLDPVFKPILDGFSGTYVEKSPSGTGLHILLKCDEQPYRTGRSRGWKDETDKQNKKREVAFFFDSRFFTVTGEAYSGSEIIGFTKEQVREVLAPWIHDPEPVPFIPNPTAITMDDVEIIRRASGARNKEKFVALYKFAAWEGRYSSQSEADAALASLLTFWTQDPSQIQKIMEHSALAREKWVKRPDYLERTIQRAINNATETYGSLQRKKDRENNRVFSSGSTDTTELLPGKLPDHAITLLDGLARIGKTQWALEAMLDAGQGLFIAHTHSSLENAMDIFAELLENRGIHNKKVACMVGKGYCCTDESRTGDCRGCPKAPKNPNYEDKPGISILELKSIARRLLAENPILTKKNIPPEYCPYQIFRFAHADADYVFLVPFFSTVDDKDRKVLERGLVVIDEGPTCDHYRTPSAEIATYTRSKRGGNVFPAWNGTIEEGFARLKEYISKRNEGKDQKISNRINPVDMALMKILDKFQAIHDIIIRFNQSPNTETFNETKDALNEIEFLNDHPEKFKLQVLRKATEYCIEADLDSDEIAPLFTIALYPAKCPYSWQGKNPQTLFFIPDDSLYRLHDADNLLVIGATQAEKFVTDYAAKKGLKDVHKIRVTGFPFSKNYLFIRLIGPGEERNPENEEKILAAQWKQLVTMVHANLKRNNRNSSKYPALLITASKKKQNWWFKRLGPGSTIITNHDIDGIWSQVFCAGCIGIFTQNSTISRSLDIPFFDRTYFARGGFATPVQIAKIQALEEQKQKDTSDSDTSEYNEKIDDIWSEIKAIQTDEITNNVLRSAPIRSDPSEQRLKVVIMCDDDYQKLDPRIRQLTESITISEDDDLDQLLDALDSVQHPVTPTDACPDRPKPARSKTAPPITAGGPLLSLDEQLRCICEFRQYRVKRIDRTAMSLTYEKIINQVVKIPRLTTENKSGHFGRLGKDALINLLFKWNNKHIPKKVIENCILLALHDRILVDVREKGSSYYSLHENVIGKLSGTPQKGPPYPPSLDIIHLEEVSG